MSTAAHSRALATIRCDHRRSRQNDAPIRCELDDEGNVIVVFEDEDGNRESVNFGPIDDPRWDVPEAVRQQYEDLLDWWDDRAETDL